MNAENVVKALIQDAAYAFEFDVTTGQLTEDILQILPAGGAALTPLLCWIIQ